MRTPVLSRLFVAFYAIWVTSGSAAEITTEIWRGHTVLKLAGKIDPGTAELLSKALKTVKPLEYGLPVLLLDSLGGLVGEALKISKVLDEYPVHTVIPDGAKCASACASIVFIAGKARTLEETGLLGQHSCAINGLPDPNCNEIISQHAITHGVSHGSVKAFVSYVMPDKILWFSRQDADGWGLTKYPGEEWSDFQKSEPRVIEMLFGKSPPAQAAWRITFRGDGYQAFLRPASDAEREEELNIFCNERFKGHLFLGMEVNGPADKVRSVVRNVTVRTDISSWSDQKPIVIQTEPGISEIISDMPLKEIEPFLTNARTLEVNVFLPKPYVPMIARTLLANSRRVLLFAANHCVSGH